MLGLRLATGGKRAPVVVDFFLCLAVDLKRNRFIELEMGAAIEAGKRLPVQLEADRQHQAFRHAVNVLASLAVMSGAGDF
ncbi:hypothetical protein D3C84_988430 [compost metagenome]